METSTYDIYLIKGNLTVFCGDHGKEFKSDILNSSLLGELSSTSKHPSSRQELFGEYVNTVSKLGWIERSREFSQYDFFAKDLSKIVDSCIGRSLTKEDKQALFNAFMQLKNSPAQPTIIQAFLDKLQANVFIPGVELNSLRTTKKTIATSTRLTIVRNNASIITLQIAFKTTDGINSDILDHPVLNSIQDGKSNVWLWVSSLDEREHGKFRARVIEKIGNHIHTGLLHVTPSIQVD